MNEIGVPGLNAEIANALSAAMLDAPEDLAFGTDESLTQLELFSVAPLAPGGLELNHGFSGEMYLL